MCMGPNFLASLCAGSALHARTDVSWRMPLGFFIYATRRQFIAAPAVGNYPPLTMPLHPLPPSLCSSCHDQAASGGGGGELLFDDLRAALASVSSSLGRGSAPFAACACDPGQHGEARPSSDPVRTPQPPQPAAALELLSPVTCCSGSSADLAAVQRQGAACAAAASAAAPSPRPLPSVAAEVQTQHPAAAADNEPADGTTPQRSAKEVTPQQPNAQQRGVAPVRLLPRVDRLPRIAMTPVGARMHGRDGQRADDTHAWARRLCYLWACVKHGAHGGAAVVAASSFALPMANRTCPYLWRSLTHVIECKAVAAQRAV